MFVTSEPCQLEVFGFGPWAGRVGRSVVRLQLVYAAFSEGSLSIRGGIFLKVKVLRGKSTASSNKQTWAKNSFLKLRGEALSFWHGRSGIREFW